MKIMEKGTKNVVISAGERDTYISITTATVIN